MNGRMLYRDEVVNRIAKLRLREEMKPEPDAVNLLAFRVLGDLLQHTIDGRPYTSFRDDIFEEAAIELRGLDLITEAGPCSEKPEQ